MEEARTRTEDRIGRDWETHVGRRGGVRVLPAGQGVEVEGQHLELRFDVHPLLLQERRRQARRLQPMNRLDQLFLPVTAEGVGGSLSAPSRY